MRGINAQTIQARLQHAQDQRVIVRRFAGERHHDANVPSCRRRAEQGSGVRLEQVVSSCEVGHRTRQGRRHLTGLSKPLNRATHGFDR